MELVLKERIRGEGKIKHNTRKIRREKVLGKPHIPHPKPIKERDLEDQKLCHGKGGTEAGGVGKPYDFQ